VGWGFSLGGRGVVEREGREELETGDSVRMRCVRVGFRVESMGSSVGVSNQEGSLKHGRRNLVDPKNILTHTQTPNSFPNPIQVTTSHQTSTQPHTPILVSALQELARAQLPLYPLSSLVAVSLCFLVHIWV
jgi:hypothetical protein